MRKCSIEAGKGDLGEGWRCLLKQWHQEALFEEGTWLPFLEPAVNMEDGHLSPIKRKN